MNQQLFHCGQGTVTAAWSNTGKQHSSIDQVSRRLYDNENESLPELLSEVTAPTFVTDGDEDDYYCPRFRMRNRPLLLARPRTSAFFHNITATVVLTLLYLYE